MPWPGGPVLSGVSDNAATWWGDSIGAYLGWRPNHNPERFCATLDAELFPTGRNEPDAIHLGGLFCTDGIHED